MSSQRSSISDMVSEEATHLSSLHSYHGNMHYIYTHVGCSMVGSRCPIDKKKKN